MGVGRSEPSLACPSPRAPCTCRPCTGIPEAAARQPLAPRSVSTQQMSSPSLGKAVPAQMSPLGSVFLEWDWWLCVSKIEGRIRVTQDKRFRGLLFNYGL